MAVRLGWRIYRSKIRKLNVGYPAKRYRSEDIMLLAADFTGVLRTLKANFASDGKKLPGLPYSMS